MRASELNFKEHYPNFPEFAENGIDLSLTDARTITTLQTMRVVFGRAIWPGVYQANWGRAYGSETSEHYAGGGRLSTAGDVFPARGYALEFCLVAQQFPLVRGLGLYLDTDGPLDGKRMAMVHFDLRATSERVFWVRRNRIYSTLYGAPDEFWKGVEMLASFERTQRKNNFNF